MFFLGIVWVTSLYSDLMIMHQALSRSFTSDVFQISSQANNSLQLKNLGSDGLFKINGVKPKANMISATILPSRFLDIDWGDEKSESEKPSSSDESSFEDAKVENNFCSVFDPSSVNRTHLGKSTLSRNLGGSPAKLIPDRDFESEVQEQNIFSGLFLQSLKNFFRFVGLGKYSQSYLKPVTPPVVLVNRGEENHEIWVRNRLIASLPSEPQANLLRQRLKKMLRTPDLDGSQLRPAFVDGVPSIMLGNRVLFSITKEASTKVNRSTTLLAMKWINNLRSVLKAPTISLVEGQKQIYGLKNSGSKISGLASWYGDYFHGRLTANGERYNQYALSAAHKTLPFNTFLHVTNTKNGKSVVVRINDRGPYIPPRSLDLSRAAVRCIDGESDGVVPYKAVIMKPSEMNFTLNSSDISLENKGSDGKVRLVSEF